MANLVSEWAACFEHTWARPTLPRDWMSEDLCFQMTAIDSHRTFNPEATVVRMYGVTAQSHSVMVVATDFNHYMYIESPAMFLPCHCAPLMKHLNITLQQGRRVDGAIVAVSIERKSSLQGYQFNTLKSFLKIECIPSQYSAVKSLLESEFTCTTVPGVHEVSFQTYESHVPYTLRFLIDHSLSGSSWMILRAGTYTRTQLQGDAESSCQITVQCCHTAIQAQPSDGQYARIGPLRKLTFDIECQGRKGKFPEAEHDPVIQIGNHVTEYGTEKPLCKVIFCLHATNSIVGATVLAFSNEADLLMAWRMFLQTVDPDIISGYNIVNFDLPYLLNRAATLQLERFPYWGRNRCTKTTMKSASMSSKAYGTREYMEIDISGRIQLDVIVCVRREYKLRSYSLNVVATTFLNEQKEDVHHSIISVLQNGDETMRQRLAVYCLKDSYLPHRLDDKLMLTVNLIEMARVAGVTVSDLMNRGQQIKVFSQILRLSRTKNLLFPFHQIESSQTTGVGYEGATVIPPTKGFHNYPVATLDFASLYPSIMMAHNLCYTTLVPPERVHELNEDQYTKTPSGDVFVKRDVYKGILPEILEELLGARKQAKKLMATAKDPMEKAVYNGRQLALKISANSVYGFTGATVGKLPCLAISASVTGFGRVMIHSTKELVEKTYCKANGHPHDAVVLYGDTDSVMVRFGYDDDIATTMDVARKAADVVSDTFIKPIKLEFEKVYCPFLLMNKKRYAGLLHTTPDKYDYLDCKGIESVRRDNCPMIMHLISNCLKQILHDRDVPGAIAYCKRVISDLLTNRLDISHLIISKSFSRAEEDYAGKQAHIELVKRMRLRDPATAPVVGDRIPYVIVQAAKKAKQFEKTEDPIYALENSVPLDTTYYLEKQIVPPLERLFEALMDNPRQEFMFGEHTRNKHRATPSSSVGGIMKFARVTLTCLGCRTTLTSADGSSALCVTCKPQEVAHYTAFLQRRNQLECLFSRVWTQCQRCQGSVIQDVICNSRDCPVFYMRKKVIKDLEDSQKKLDRFDW